MAGFAPAALVVALSYWITHEKPTLAFSNRDCIVICDFENLTGEEVSDKSLDTALRLRITQSSYVNLVPRSRIDPALRRMKKETTIRIDEPVGLEIAQRESVKVLLVPSITGIAGTYAISSTLEDPITGQTRGTSRAQSQ